MRTGKVVLLMLFGLLLVFSGCQTAKLLPEITIVSIKTPIERSDQSILEFVTVRIVNPSNESYRAYLKWTELDTQGNTVWDGFAEREFYLYPGYDREFSLNGVFPPEEYRPGMYTLVLRLVSAGSDGTIGTPDDVTLSEDRADFELR
uniref:Intracellular proteinase inhibitor BsuPI domain-containing protein n=1 Tax=Candidatus Caldatribacterium saccharofermentans TaxID=1454753 RepID=A0A7V4TIX0_9BACT